MHLHTLVRTTSNSNGSYVADLRGKQVISFDSYETQDAIGHIPRNVSNQDFVSADSGTGACSSAQPIVPPRNCGPTFFNQVGLPPTSSTLLHSVLAKDMPQGLNLPVNSIQAVKGVFQIQESRMCFNSQTVSDSNYNNIPRHMDAKKANPYVSLTNHPNPKALITTTTACFSYQQVNRDLQHCDVSMGREVVLCGEGGSKNKLTSTQNHDQDHTSSAPKSIQEGSHSQRVTVAIPEFRSRKRAATPTAVADRLRRARINEKLKSLHELLPHRDQGKKEAVEDIVDYVKYLQLQAKALSRSKLGGDATNYPFIHLEGFGHYLLNQQILNEPLEEIIGRIMNDNMPALTEVLETKGLYLMPMSLAEGISENV